MSTATPARPPNLRIVPAGRGAGWISAGWRNFRVAPLGWLATATAYWLLMAMVSMIPWIGLVLGSILIPAFSLGLMEAARSAAGGRPVTVVLLFAGLRNDARSQVVLGVVYLAAIALSLGASWFVDGGLFARMMILGEMPSREAIVSGELLAGFAVAVLAYSPVMLAFWFAPVLSAWHGLVPAKALFFSFVACWVNWRAFCVYGFLVAVAAFVIPIVAMAVLLPFAKAFGGLSPFSLVIPVALALLPTLFATYYASYEDLFSAGDGPTDAL